jgi:hypothetical protein
LEDAAKNKNKGSADVASPKKGAWATHSPKPGAWAEQSCSKSQNEFENENEQNNN